MKATDLPDVEFMEDLRLLVWRPRGVINEAAVNKVIALLGDLEATSRNPFNRFTDTLGADAIDLNFKYVFHVSLYRRFSYRGPRVKSAILASTPAHAHYSKMHALLTQGSQIDVRVFQELDAAANWLAVSKEVLRQKTDS